MNEREKYLRSCLAGMDKNLQTMLAREDWLNQIRMNTIIAVANIDEAQVATARKLRFETYKG